MKLFIEIEVDVDESANFISCCNSVKDDIKVLMEDMIYDIDDIKVIEISVGELDD